MDEKHFSPDHDEIINRNGQRVDNIRNRPPQPDDTEVTVNRSEYHYEEGEVVDYKQHFLELCEEIRQNEEKRLDDRTAVYIPFTKRRIELLSKANKWLERAGERQIASNLGEIGEYKEAERSRKYLKPALKIATGVGAAAIMVVSGVPIVAPTVFTAGLKQAYDGVIEAIQKGGWNEKWQAQEQEVQRDLGKKFKEAVAEYELVGMTPDRFNALVAGIKGAENAVIARQNLNTKSETNQRRFRALTSSALTLGTGLLAGVPLGTMDVDKGATSVDFKGEEVEVLHDYVHRTMLRFDWRNFDLNFEFMYNKGTEAVNAAIEASGRGMELTQLNHNSDLLRSLYDQFHTMGGSLNAEAWAGLGTAAATMTATILEQWRGRKLDPRNKEVEVFLRKEQAGYGYRGEGVKRHYNDIQDEFIKPLGRALRLLAPGNAGTQMDLFPTTIVRQEKSVGYQQNPYDTERKESDLKRLWREYVAPTDLTNNELRLLLSTDALTGLADEIRTKINGDRERFEKRYGISVDPEEFFKAYRLRQTLTVLNTHLENIGVGELLDDSETIEDELPLRKGLGEAEHVAIVFDGPIGDGVIAGLPLVDAVDRYFQVNRMSKPITVITTQPGLYKDVESTYHGRVRVIGQDQVQKAFALAQAKGEKVFIINTKKEFENYSAFGLEASEELDPTRVLSVDYSTWPKQLANTETPGRYKKYDRLGARIMRGMELMVGQKLYEDIDDIDHLLEKGSDFQAKAEELRARFGLPEDKKLITISTGAGVRPKELLPSRWIAALKLIKDAHPDVHIVLLTDPDAARFAPYKEMVDYLSTLYEGSFTPVSLTLPEIPTLINMSSLTMTPDTGLGHMAGAYGVPSVMVHIGNSVPWSQPATRRIDNPTSRSLYRAGGSVYGEAWNEDNKNNFYIPKGDQWVGASNTPAAEIAEAANSILEGRSASVATHENATGRYIVPDSLEPGDEVFTSDFDSRVFVNIGSQSVEVGTISRQKDGTFFVLGMDGNSVKDPDGNLITSVSLDQFEVRPR